MDETTKDQVRATVRAAYGTIAREGGSCGCAPSGCCGPSTTTRASVGLGYGEGELASLPEGADMGLGCGNPHAIASLREGETVLDLGSGGGLDALLAARRVGPRGRVIGVDMTPEMISKARASAAAAGATQVEFRLGEIERLPVADSTVDVILSNCVINLSPDKRSVFAEAHRVLRKGGRLALADVVATRPVPDAIRADLAASTGCIAGAASLDEIRSMLEEIGFEEVRVTVKEETRTMMDEWMPGTGAGSYVASATIEARKSEAACCIPLPEAGRLPGAAGGCCA